MLLATLSMPPSQAIGAEGSAPVTVVNTPLPVTGNTTVSGTVDIGNTPTVNAQQSGRWNVGILGTPTVNIGSGNVTATPLAIGQIYEFRDKLRTAWTYPFDAPMMLVSLEVCTENEIAVWVETDVPVGGNPAPGGMLSLGRFNGDNQQCRVVNLGGAIQGKGIRVVNRDLFFDATFSVVALGY